MRAGSPIVGGRLFHKTVNCQLAGRQRPTIEEDALLRQLGLIMQSFALRKQA